MMFDLTNISSLNRRVIHTVHIYLFKCLYF